MSKLYLVITKGCPASGKTTFARNWVTDGPTERIRVNRDEIRRQLGPYWIPSREEYVTIVEDFMIVSALMNDYSVIVDATNMNGIKRFEELVESIPGNIEIVIEDFTHVPLDVLLERDKNRPKEEQVGEDVIRKFYKRI